MTKVFAVISNKFKPTDLLVVARQGEKVRGSGGRGWRDASGGRTMHESLEDDQEYNVDGTRILESVSVPDDDGGGEAKSRFIPCVPRRR